jgi:CHAT domain-containing protein
VKKIAYSPAGKLYSISFNALATADSGKLLIDKYQLDQYGSTREVALRETVAPIKPANITLFGNADFSLDSQQLMRRKTVKLKDSSFAVATHHLPSRGVNGVAWGTLSGTGAEIKKISDLFKKNKLQSTSYTKSSASEDNLKALDNKSPQILHIATHGYFLPALPGNFNQKDIAYSNPFNSSENPLLRTGLVLAGANYAWSGRKPIEGVEDGIATAYEISQLNLSNTELVVLSACETGLGDIKGSEGVYGLQRAFRMAGAKKLIVSLWQVPDKETAELMTAFYSYWMKGNAIPGCFLKSPIGHEKKIFSFLLGRFYPDRITYGFPGCLYLMVK